MKWHRCLALPAFSTMYCSPTRGSYSTSRAVSLSHRGLVRPPSTSRPPYSQIQGLSFRITASGLSHSLCYTAFLSMLQAGMQPNGQPPAYLTHPLTHSPLRLPESAYYQSKGYPDRSPSPCQTFFPRETSLSRCCHQPTRAHHLPVSSFIPRKGRDGWGRGWVMGASEVMRLDAWG